MNSLDNGKNGPPLEAIIEIKKGVPWGSLHFLDKRGLLKSKKKENRTAKLRRPPLTGTRGNKPTIKIKKSNRVIKIKRKNIKNKGSIQQLRNQKLT